MSTQLITVVGLIALALSFDYINGFHDAANSIATVVSTRVLSPGQAVVWAAFFNFVAFFVLKYIFRDEHGVANTIKQGVVNPAYVTVAVVAAGLSCAITWNLITWYYGIPSSSCRRRHSASATAPTTLRRPPASSPRSSIRAASSPASSTCRSG